MPIDLNSKNKSVNTTSNKPQLQFELTEPRYTLDDLILSEKTYSELNKAIGLRQFQGEVFNDWGFSHTHKFDSKMIINLYGTPGTGKTMAAHAIATSLGKKLILVNYGDIEYPSRFQFC